MVVMRLWPRSYARRQREALEQWGLAWAEGMAKGIRDAEAHAAARPEGISVEDWRRQGLAEAYAALDANPQYHRMVAAAQMMLGVDDEDEQP